MMVCLHSVCGSGLISSAIIVHVLSVLPLRPPLDMARHRTQARVNGLKSCVIVLRILRDMCNRHSVWEPLKGWVSSVVYNNYKTQSQFITAVLFS